MKVRRVWSETKNDLMRVKSKNEKKKRDRIN